MKFTYEDIDAYLSGELSDAARQDFETAMASDAELNSHVEAFRLTQSTIGKHHAANDEAERLTNLLTPLTNEHFKAEKQMGKVVSMRRTFMAIAAAACIVGLVFLMIPGVSLNDIPVEAMSGATTRGETTPMSVAAKLFNEKRYEEAIAAFLSIRKEDTTANNAEVQFYLGVSLVKTKQDAMALPLFESLSSGSSVYQEDARFFAALSAYHLKDMPKAKLYAAQVKKENKYFAFAEKLLKEIGE
jgi:tetratricopeptide (TPR) repeat protein